MSEKILLNTHGQLERRALKLSTLVYLIQAISLITLVPFLIAAIINYSKRGAVDGTLAESHFRWQIRTFWFGMLWVAVGWIIFWSYVLALNLLAPIIGQSLHLLLLLLGLEVVGIGWLWVAYRVIRGWITLADGLPAYPGRPQNSEIIGSLRL